MENSPKTQPIQSTAERFPQPTTASRILVDPEDRVPVELWLDANSEVGRFRVVPSRCHLIQSEAPCRGKIAKGACRGLWRHCNHPGKAICGDEWGRVAKDPMASPGWTREWALFAREDYRTRSYIDEFCLIDDPRTGRKAMSHQRRAQAVIRCLLRDWSLGNRDSRLAIRLVSEPSMPCVVIPEDQMKLITSIDHAVLEGFLEGFYRASRDGEFLSGDARTQWIGRVDP